MHNGGPVRGETYDSFLFLLCPRSMTLLVYIKHVVVLSFIFLKPVLEVM